MTPEQVKARKNNSVKIRRKWQREGVAFCAVPSCRWAGPPSLQSRRPLVECHHILGVGSPALISDIEFQIALCPNHHTIAERAWPECCRGYNTHPKSKEDLIAKLMAFDEEMEAARNSK